MTDTYKLKFYALLNSYPDYTCVYTDESKEGDRVSFAAVSGQRVMKCHLPGSASIFSAELQAILLALDFIECSNLDKFLICSDSLSALQAIHNHKFNNSFVQRVLEKCHFLFTRNKVVSFCWVPSHVGISGNERADVAATSALSLPVSDIKIPYSDLKQQITSFFLNKWQTKWNTVFFNKLQAIKKTLGETKFEDVVKRRDELVLH